MLSCPFAATCLSLLAHHGLYMSFQLGLHPQCLDWLGILRWNCSALQQGKLWCACRCECGECGAPAFFVWNGKTTWLKLLQIGGIRKKDLGNSECGLQTIKPKASNDLPQYSIGYT